MNKSVLSPKKQQYVEELMKRKTIGEESLSDQTLLNYLCSVKIDEDYLYMRRSHDLKCISA